MSMWGRAAAGIGGAAAGLANKYIDEELATQRAQALADIQRTSSMQQLQDKDTFLNDPSRVARDRANKVADISAEGTARSDVDLAARKKAAVDPELLAADVSRAGAITGATAKASADAQTAAELAKITNPAYISAERKLALAKHVESAGSTAQAALANFQLGVAKNMQGLREQLAEAQTTGNKAAAEDIQAQLDALDGKGGKVDKFYVIAEKATAGMAAANKILNDPMATPDAKDEANAQIRQQRAILESAAKRAGVTDIAEARYAKPSNASVQALMKNPEKAADFDAMFGPGAAKKLLGDAPAPTAKPSLAERARAAAPVDEYVPPADSVVGKARAKAASLEQDRAAQSEQQRQQAAAAFASLPPGDKAAAARLQASPLFGLLPRDQQVSIYNTVNGR